MQEILNLDLERLSVLKKEGLIQRFEYTLDLAWKTLKDKMEFDGLILNQISPKMVMKEAYKNKYIDNIELWLDMINDRNLVSHTYDIDVVMEIIPDIQKKYTPLLLDFHKSLLEV